jgi:hypothetical protein
MGPLWLQTFCQQLMNNASSSLFYVSHTVHLLQRSPSMVKCMLIELERASIAMRLLFNSQRVAYYRSHDVSKCALGMSVDNEEGEMVLVECR